ncbi:putative ATP-dependent permease [Cyphellophora attinorum]|uniref:Putative ATP-dependent permease n=1 Tax=Cyphellophora attinorum TaxID=1664694 RepID=A0A0N1HHE5_9EURO|nr:putative ATP-dependent permease [Phialophora attinorum]KPI45410.1 putative ATP-dependent permease [Phialophora attinorum]
MPRSPVLEQGQPDFSERDITGDGMRTESSSTRAVKSVASISNVSMDTPSIRPKGTRRISLKQKQDRALFTRKKSIDNDQTPPTPRTDDEDNDGLLPSNRSARSWLRLAKRDSTNPPQIMEDPDNLPADANTDLDILVSSFKSSDVAQSIHNEIMTSLHSASSANGQATDENFQPVTGSIKGFMRISWPRQFLILSRRTWRNLYRNPMLMLTHYAVAILLAVLSGWLFYGLSDDIGGFQNRLGLFFFLLALFGFSTLTSLNTFSSERAIFVRERANGYYSPITYFAAKVIFDMVPLRLIPPIIMGMIVYPMSGLLPKWGTFFTFILILVLFNLAAAAICLFIGIVFRDTAVANLIGSLVMLFSLLFAGLLLNLNHDTVQAAAQWLQMLSIFHYGYEGLIVNEVAKLRLKDHRYGLDIEVPGASILSAFGFDNLAMWSDVIGLGVFGGAFIIIAYIAMHFLLVEKR